MDRRNGRCRLTRRNATRGLTGLVLVVAAAVASFSAAAVAAPPSRAVSSSDAAGIPARTLPVAAAYVHGKDWRRWVGHKATLSPIRVGWVNHETGLIGRPQHTINADAAVALLNNNLGGIAGHPIKLVKCFTSDTEEDGQKCAQQMANDPSIKVILIGDLLVGGASFYTTLHGAKPVLGVIPYGPETSPTTTNTYIFGGGPNAFRGIVNVLKDVYHAHKVSWINLDLPLIRQITRGFVQLANSSGLDVDTVFYPVGATDLIAPVTAANPNSHDAVIPTANNDAGCLALARALQQVSVSKPIFANGQCLSPAVKKGLGDYPHWIYFMNHANPSAPHSKTGQVALYLAAMKKYGTLEAAHQYYSPLVFGTVLTFAKWAEEIGVRGLSSASVAAKAMAFRGPMFLGPPNIRFGQQPFPNIGSLQSRWFEYLGNGRFKDAARGRWWTPPQG